MNFAGMRVLERYFKIVDFARKKVTQTRKKILKSNKITQ